MRHEKWVSKSGLEIEQGIVPGLLQCVMLWRERIGSQGGVTSVGLKALPGKARVMLCTVLWEMTRKITV